MSVPARVCVYAASSKQADPSFYEAAASLGALLAGAGVEIVYGGGAVGAMGALADGALAAGGRVVGILPHFMKELEWQHPGLSELEVVDTMHARKARMVEGADAVVALPGGCGTFEELLEVITWKRLGLFVEPIVLVNVRGYFDPFQAMMERCVAERFMDPRHLDMWTLAGDADAVLEHIASSMPWSSEARGFAVP